MSLKPYQWVWLPIVAISTSAYATTYFSVEQAQRAIFPGASFKTVAPNVWKTSQDGTFIVDKVVGKHEFITIAVGINANGTIKQIEIMQYNESYGYEVRSARWRAQFIGKSTLSPLELNVDIRNIGGATLSSKHITDAVKRLLETYGHR